MYFVGLVHGTTNLWHMSFSAVPFLIYFSRSASLTISRRTCVHTHTYVGAETAYELELLLRYMPEGHRFDSRWCHWNFSLTLTSRPHYGPGVGSASKRNEHQQYFLEVRAAGA